jgi:hypothetical protein
MDVFMHMPNYGLLTFWYLVGLFFDLEGHTFHVLFEGKGS